MRIEVRPGSLARKFPQLRELATETLKREIEQGAVDIREEARARAPVESGELRAGIVDTVSADGMIRDIESTAPHAVFVEFGTSDTPPQPHLFPAAEHQKPRIRARVQRQMRAAAKRLVSS